MYIGYISLGCRRATRHTWMRANQPLKQLSAVCMVCMVRWAYLIVYIVYRYLYLPESTQLGCIVIRQELHKFIRQPLKHLQIL